MQLSKLAEPFLVSEVEWRIGSSGKKSSGGFWAKALAYVTNRAIMDRLDEVCGPENWKNEFKEWTVGGKAGVLCGISVKVNGEWITKWDGAENTDFEAVKGGLSDSMKRAAVQWSLGRYLYNLDATFVECSPTKGNETNNYATTKEKEAFYWKTPTLPPWALPQVGKKPVQPPGVITKQEADVLEDMLHKYDFETDRFLTWASKAAKHDVVTIAQLPRSLFQKAKDLLEAEGQKVSA